jgi:hypothetical protein
MKKLTLALLCTLPLLAHAELVDKSTKTTMIDLTQEMESKYQLLLGTWQCHSSPHMTEKYADVSATYQFLPNDVLKVSKVSKIDPKKGGTIYYIDSEKTWKLYRHAKHNITFFTEQVTALTRFDSENADPKQAQSIKKYAQDTKDINMIAVSRLTEDYLQLGYGGMVAWDDVTRGVDYDVFRCHRVGQEVSQSAPAS